MHANLYFTLELVWKVARYTSAAPLFFSEMDHYVDGAVLANNPCEYALTAINNFYRLVYVTLYVNRQQGTCIVQKRMEERQCISTYYNIY